MRMRALVTADFDEAGLRLLRQHADVRYEPWSRSGRLLLAQELAQKVVDLRVDILVVEVDLVHEEVFDARPIKAIGCCRSAPVNVDLERASEEGIPVVYAPGRNRHAVADLTLAFMLNLARQVIPLHQRLVSGDYNPDSIQGLLVGLHDARGYELGSTRVGLVGLGAIGREVARRLTAFGAQTAAYDPLAEERTFADHGVDRIDIDTLFAESDIVSLHCPAIPATRGIASAARIASMKEGAVLINTARHSLVDEPALLDALKTGRLRGAGLDVFRTEPPLPDDPFLRLPNVIATPHVGGATQDVVRHQSGMVAADLDRILRGQTPRHAARVAEV